MAVYNVAFVSIFAMSSCVCCLKNDGDEMDTNAALQTRSVSVRAVEPGWCLPDQTCQRGDCCAQGTSCNTCPFGWQVSNEVCQGRGNRQCYWKTHDNSTNPGWCLPADKCDNGDCCAQGTSCNTCPNGWMVSDDVCAGKGNRQCKYHLDMDNRLPQAGWCLPHQQCDIGDCCAEGTSCNTCPVGFKVSNDVCAGKGNRQCKLTNANNTPGWCLPSDTCTAGDCCAQGTSCNTCPFGWMVNNDQCAGRGNRQCRWRQSEDEPGWCLPHESCDVGDCCAQGTSCNTCPHGWVVSDDVCAGKGNRRCIITPTALEPGWCLPHEECNAGDCCAQGTSCNTCPYGWMDSNDKCAGKGNRQCYWTPHHGDQPGWCLPDMTCNVGDCCAQGTSCNTCPNGWEVSDDECAGKGNRRCKE